MSTSYYYEEMIRGHHEEQRRNELRSQLVAHLRAEQLAAPERTRSRDLLALVTRPYRSRGPREAFSQ